MLLEILQNYNDSLYIEFKKKKTFAHTCGDKYKIWKIFVDRIYIAGNEQSV